MRERWFGATGRLVPEIVLEGDETVSLEHALVVESLEPAEPLAEAHREGRPVVVRCADEDAVRRALARPEVSCALVPAARADLLELDLRRLTYG